MGSETWEGRHLHVRKPYKQGLSVSYPEINIIAQPEATGSSGKTNKNVVDSPVLCHKRDERREKMYH